MTKKSRLVYGWLWLGAALVTFMVIIGGITRLTGSGLSMTDWNLIMGSIPPLNEADWNAAFAQYKQFPEFQQVNSSMDLAGFKQIFFWEYLHRLIGRMIGIIFIIPFLFFWLRGYFDSTQKKHMLILLGLGALQGAMGWFMVKSGLVDMPFVSHYRLAAHFMLAVILIGFCIWYAQNLRPAKNIKKNNPHLKKVSLAIGIVFVIQLIWGAFTAGLHAGYIYNTFPLMDGSLFPSGMWNLQPLLLNLVENHALVQWIHRVNGTLLLALTIYYWAKVQFSDAHQSKKINAILLLGVISIQYLLGILTLLNYVPVSLGVAHQFVAVVFGIVWLIGFHDLKHNRLASQRL